MKTDSRISRYLFVSPWSLCAFFVIPLMVVLSVKFHVRVPFAGNKYPLLINNACFGILAALRCCYYLLGLIRFPRYRAGQGAPRGSLTYAKPLPAVRGSFAAAGFLFDASGRYAEKKDGGYLGTVLLYAGLFLAIFTGTLDNARQFSGTLLDGIGTATDLNLVEKYHDLLTGPLSKAPSNLPKMQIVNQFMPSDSYPRGATEVSFKLGDDPIKTVLLKAPEAFRSGGYDIYMSKMVYEPSISIAIDNSTPVFTGTVRLDPLTDKIDDYGFYGTFVQDSLNGEVFFQPEKSRLRLILHQGPQVLIDKVLVFQGDRRQVSGNLSFVCEKMGVWSEIHVVHRRHMSVILAGAFCFLLGLLVRVAIPVQRVWLEEVPQGCTVRTSGKEACRVVADLG